MNAVTNQQLSNQQFNLVSLLIGVNNQFQSRPFSQYQIEFPALLDSAIAYAGGQKSHVFIVSIPDYAYTPYGQQTASPATISSELDQYNAFSRHIADSLHITYFDITPISRQGLQIPTYVASDGLHPSGTQYTEWVKLMLEYIDSLVLSSNSELQVNKDFNIQLNPSTNVITIKQPEVGNKQYGTVQLYNLNGSMLLQQKLSGTVSILAIEQFPDALYLIKVNSNGKQAILRIIKKDSE